MREAPSVYLIKELIKRGASINAYDPKAMKEAKEVYLKGYSVLFNQEKYAALENANALILLTEWKEFRSPDFSRIKSQLKEPVVFDGRNQYNSFDLEKSDFEYYQIGKN